MKKLIFFCLAALVTVYCFGADVKYVVKGSGAKDGTVVYLVDKLSSERINSAVVSRGSFQMKGKAPKDAFLAVQADGSGWQCLFFNDGQNVQVNLADSTVTGSPLNTHLTECDKKTYKATAKGFDIVGLSFDRDKDPWVKAITDWDMPWIHLSDLKYWKSVAAGLYGVNAIPDNLLIDPQGTVVARGLRGQALRQKLAEIFQ